MRGLLRLVVVLAALGLVAELLAPSWVASRAEAAITEETEGRVTVDVDVSGPPLLLPVARDGTVERWTLDLQQVAGTDVGGRGVDLDATVDLHEVVLDRGRLVRGDVVVTHVGQADATVRIDLSEQVPEALQPFADRLAEAGLARLLEATGGGTVEQRGGALVFGDLELPLVDGACDVTSDDLVVTAHCALAEVPPLLLRAFR